MMKTGIRIALSVAVVLVIATALRPACALECYSCKKAETNEECNQKTESCNMNDPACITEARNQNGEILLDKGCKQSGACANNEANNPPECEDGQVAHKCQYCCDTDLCNEEVHNFTAIGNCDEGSDSRDKDPTGYCYSCSGESSNSDCMDVEECTMNNPSCQTELTNVDGTVYISKRCKQTNACDNNEQNNRLECNDGIVEHKCRYCCSGDYCNGDPPDGFEEKVIECGEWGLWTECGMDCKRERNRSCLYTEDDHQYYETDMEACEHEEHTCTLLCYVCEQEYDNSVCREVTECPSGQFCQNVIEGDCHGNVFVTKRCQAYEECDASTRDNPDSCGQISPFGDLLDYELGYGEQCSYCCTGNFCNGPLVPREALQVGVGVELSAVPKLVMLIASFVLINIM
ncbi:LDL receptor repeat-containing protein egg-2-like [Ptychodera flava]|uniref:LDL receptor repeat-containing protein egg-2-like n=1 Tax=Ptychodera flava TaxID=63121 RepID=UPI00396A5EA2